MKHLGIASARTLTLDGAVKCVQGRLPPPGLLEKFQNLQHLSIANVGVSSLEQFPRLRSLHSLILSDNRIAGGLEFLVEAGLDSLRDLDLSNNRIQYIEDLAPPMLAPLVENGGEAGRVGANRPERVPTEPQRIFHKLNAVVVMVLLLIIFSLPYFLINGYITLLLVSVLLAGALEVTGNALM